VVGLRDGRRRGQGRACPADGRAGVAFPSDAETRAQATQDALDTVPAEPPTDALLDFAAGLQRALRGSTRPAAWPRSTPPCAKCSGRSASGGTTRRFTSMPVLHMNVADRPAGRPPRGLLPGRTYYLDNGPPPMRWLDATSRNRTYSQLLLHIVVLVALPVGRERGGPASRMHQPVCELGRVDNQRTTWTAPLPFGPGARFRCRACGVRQSPLCASGSCRERRAA
jgi:hypothetical protein